MDKPEFTPLSRRKLIAALIASAGAAAVPGCERRKATGDTMWAGFDDRITERTLAEAEKLLGLRFTEDERRMMLGDAAVEDANGPFAEQVAGIQRRRDIDAGHADLDIRHER